MLTNVYFTLLVLSISGVLSKKRCCAGIDCFSNDYPYGHMPLPQCPSELDISLRLNTQTNRDRYELMTSDFIPPSFDSNSRVIVMVHGWLGVVYTEWLNQFKDAFLEKEQLNVITVKWGSTNLYYPQSAANVRSVAATIHSVMAKIVKDYRKVNPANIYCIGHSLGAQTCAHLGKLMKIGRITGLDPAGPWFEGYHPSSYLNPNDADLVDVIHTNTRALTIAPGFKAPTGHIDFYVNGGGKQPGCIADPLIVEPEEDNNQIAIPFPDMTLACSHNRAVAYFRESIEKYDCLHEVTQQCDDHLKLPKSCSDCPNGPCQRMGYEAEKYPARGIFYLTTARRKPFCRV